MPARGAVALDRFVVARDLEPLRRCLQLGVGGWSCPLSDSGHETLQLAIVGVLCECVSQPFVPDFLANAVHHGEGAFVGVPCLIDATGVLQKSPQCEFGLPLLNGIPE